MTNTRSWKLATLLSAGLCIATPAAAHITRMVSSQRPTCRADGPSFLVTLTTAADIADCGNTDDGVVEAPCLCVDGSYIALGATGGGGSGDTFSTIDAPSGTDPVASGTSTLALVAGAGISITGDSSTDALTFAATSGGWSGPVSIINPPASPHAYDCEFDSLAGCPSWSLGSGWTNATVTPWAQRSAGQFYYDFASWPGWMLLQGDNTSATVKTLLTLPVTNDTTMTLVTHLLGGQSLGSATSERRLHVCLQVSADTNEQVCVGWQTTGTTYYFESYVNNNGTVTSCTQDVDAGSATVSDVAFVLWRTTTAAYYTTAIALDGGGIGGGKLCSLTKTGTTAMDEIAVLYGSDDDTVSPVLGLDFVRYYSDLTMAFVAGPEAGVGANTWTDYGTTLETADTERVIIDAYPADAGSAVDDAPLYINSDTAGANDLVVWVANSALNGVDAGSEITPALVDIDADGDYDLFECEEGCFAYKNTGSASAPAWTREATWDVPDVATDQSAGFADLDNDGDFDAMVGHSTGFVLGYKNTGSASAPTWAAETGWDLGVDVGSYAAPALADLDDDGDFDMIVFQDSGLGMAYANVGSASAPTWSRTAGWDTPDAGNRAKSSGFCDFDNDGDLDVVVATQNDTGVFMLNGGDASTPSFSLYAPWMLPDLTPTQGFWHAGTADLDGDGDCDVLSGYNNGLPRGVENVGTLGSGAESVLFGVATEGSERFAVRGGYAHFFNEVKVNGLASDGTGKVVCVKSDGKLGTCSDAPNSSGVCTCG